MSERTNGVDDEGMGVAKVYAQAAWNLAVRQNATKELEQELDDLVDDVLDKQPDLDAFFKLGSISVHRREESLERIFKGKLSDLSYNLLLTLNRHDRLPFLRSVRHAVRELSDKSQGKVKARVRSAVPLSEKQASDIKATLAKNLSIEPDLVLEVDPSLLGGLWIRIGDTVYDRTVRHNLRTLRDNILTRSSHEIQSGRDSVGRSEGN